VPGATGGQQHVGGPDLTAHPFARQMGDTARLSDQSAGEDTRVRL
jgi:hypothetical protein